MPGCEHSERDMESGRDPRPGILRALLIALLASGTLLLASACGGGGGGGGGSSGGSTGGGGYDDGGNDDDVDDDTGDIQPTLASIQSHVFTPVCTQCHTGANAPEGLRLDEGVAYGMLVNVESNQVPSLFRVEPGNPDDSYIVHKIEGTNAVGERMPLGGPYLSADEIAAIRQWISDGASDTSSAVSGKTTLAAGWPVAGSELDGPPNNITLIGDGELDASTLHAGTVRVLRVDTREARVLENVDMTLSSLAPTVIQLRIPEDEWQPGLYEVRVSGDESAPVLDRHARIIDGDEDGIPGGDFVLDFRINRK